MVGQVDQDTVRTKVLTPDQYFGTVRTAYARFLSDITAEIKAVHKHPQIACDENFDRILETAQKLTVNYMICIQQNMVDAFGEVTPVVHEILVDGLSADVERVEYLVPVTPPTEAVKKAFVAIRAAMGEEKKLVSETANVLADKVRSSKMTALEKRTVIELIVQAQLGKLPEVSE